jgi:hypothetical protein
MPDKPGRYAVPAFQALMVHTSAASRAGFLHLSGKSIALKMSFCIHANMRYTDNIDILGSHTIKNEVFFAPVALCILF